MEYRVSRFPMLSRFFLTANEKDFSLSLEMTVWESGILASLPSHAGKALVRGCGSPSFLWKEVPRRGGGWLTQRNKKEWIRSIFLYRPPKHSRGRFFVNRSLFPARMKRRDLKAYGVRRFPFSDALLFLLDRKRKRFLAHARNDGTGETVFSHRFLIRGITKCRKFHVDTQTPKWNLRLSIFRYLPCLP